MASKTGSLQNCQQCKRNVGIASPLSLVEGTGPENATDEWEETYECPEGHTGRYKVVEPSEDNNWERTETFCGACASYNNE